MSSAVVVGHLYTYEGHLPDTAHIQKIVDWLICKLLTEVQGFLGTVGTIWIFIKDYATIACLLVHITQKDIEFTFGKQELEAMKKLKILAKKLTCNLCNQLCKWTQSHTCYEYILHCCQIYSFSNWGWCQAISLMIWVNDVIGEREQVLIDKTWAFWSFSYIEGLLDLDNWGQKSSSWSQCKIYQGNDQQSRYST